jgi:hypothetical protein
MRNANGIKVFLRLFLLPISAAANLIFANYFLRARPKTLVGIDFLPLSKGRRRAAKKDSRPQSESFIISTSTQISVLRAFLRHSSLPLQGEISAGDMRARKKRSLRESIFALLLPKRRLGSHSRHPQ